MLFMAGYGPDSEIDPTKRSVFLRDGVVRRRTTEAAPAERPLITTCSGFPPNFYSY
jgi:hypothetical protein